MAGNAIPHCQQAGSWDGYCLTLWVIVHTAIYTLFSLVVNSMLIQFD